MSEKTPEYHHLSRHHHMHIHWNEFFDQRFSTIAREGTIVERTSLVGQIGLLLLSCGTGAWRVRDSMNKIARSLDMTCSADIGLVSLQYTCFDTGEQSCTQVLSLPSTNVNMAKLDRLERFVDEFAESNGEWTIGEIHKRLLAMNRQPSKYQPIHLGLAAGLACSAFIFLLGGSWPEMICSFFGAGFGNFVRAKMGKHQLTLLAKIVVSVSLACLVYFLAFQLLSQFGHVSWVHEDGYIGAMLFVIPGFPFITAGLDFSKSDLRSGLERLAYALLIILVATYSGWCVALLLNMHPHSFAVLHLAPSVLFLFRLVASFCGVFGFSIMFNSTVRMALTAGLVGAIANTLRLSLISWYLFPAGGAAFLGALTAGLLASIVGRKVGYPRIGITVPAIVIMVPGLYMYEMMFNFGLNSIANGAMWAAKTLMIILALPLGLITARILTDKIWRKVD